MILREFRKIGLVVGSIFLAGILIFSRDLGLVFCYLLGFLTSNICLSINSHFIEISASKNAMVKNMLNYLFRLALYAITMTLAFKLMDLPGLIIAFLGCLNIRMAIVVHAIKGG